MRLISSFNCSTSSFMAMRSSSELVLLPAWMANSRIRCNMLVTSVIAPSAVCAILIPSLAFLMAMLRPRTCEVMRVLMAKPAASSLAELIFLPVDKRSMACDKATLLERIESPAINDLTLVLITVMIFTHSKII